MGNIAIWVSAYIVYVIDKTRKNRTYRREVQ